MSVTYYKRGGGHVDARSRRAREEGVKDARYDMDGNLIGGVYEGDGRTDDGTKVREGSQYLPPGKPPTAIDKFKAENNLDVRGFQAVGEPDDGPRTSWGMSWADALRSSRAKEDLNAQYQEDRMSKFRKFKMARAKIRKRGIDTTNPAPNVGSDDFRKKIKSTPYEGSYR